MEDIIGMVVYLAAKSIAGVNGMVQSSRLQNRQRHLRILAERMGLTFRSQKSEGVYNQMKGTLERRDVEVFDLDVFPTPQTQVVVSVTLPEFTLRPERLTDPKSVYLRDGKLCIEGRDVNFDSHTAFSSTYWLVGPDEGAVRSVFRQEVLTWFEAHPGWTVFSGVNLLCIYRSHHIPPEDGMSAFLQDVMTIVGLLAPAQSS